MKIPDQPRVHGVVHPTGWPHLDSANASISVPVASMITPTFLRSSTGLVTSLVVGLWAGSVSLNAQLVNSGFEGGIAVGWTVANEAGGLGNWYTQTGAGSPTNGFSIASPPESIHAAMTDQPSAGSHLLYQDFVVPAGVTGANLTFKYTIRNSASDFITLSGLSYAGAANQQARVDIITATADVFSVAPADVLLNIFQTHPGDPLNSGAYNTLSTDLTALFAAHAGATLRLRFAEVDNQFYFSFGIDDVQLTAIPEPSTYGLLGGLAVLVLAIRRRLK